MWMRPARSTARASSSQHADGVIADNEAVVWLEVRSESRWSRKSRALRLCKAQKWSQRSYSDAMSSASTVVVAAGRWGA
jgi:hypothetical protein